MRAYRKKTQRSGESGSFWLSFSDMMSVMVLIFIFVIFGMMYSLEENRQKLVNMQNEYSIALQDLESGKQEQERLIVLLDEKETELTEMEQELTETQRSIVILQGERDAAQESLSAKEAELLSAQEQLNRTETELSALEAAYSGYGEELAALQAKLSANETFIIDLRRQKEEADAQYGALQQQYALLTQDKSMLESNIAKLNRDIEALETSLEAKRREYNQLAAQSESDNRLITQYQTEIADYREQLSQTQAELERRIGVKSQIIERLSSELRTHRISVDVDAQTGAISLASKTLFSSGKSDLSDEGKRYLDQLLPVYLGVLLSDEFRPYIAEIVIEGHTDSAAPNGWSSDPRSANDPDSYIYNLDLSQQRALAVSDYILNPNYMRTKLGLTNAEISELREMISASGRSFSSLIRYTNGKENAEASRRVEIKFALKDDETIDTTRELLKLIEQN